MINKEFMKNSSYLIELVESFTTLVGSTLMKLCRGLVRMYNWREKCMIRERGWCSVFPVMNGIHINITFFIRFSPESLLRLYFQCYLKVCFVGSGPNVGDSIMLVMSLGMSH